MEPRGLVDALAKAAECQQMTIKYLDGTSLNALLLSRANDTLRVIVPGDDDVRTFTLIREAWISEKCEAVKIEFAWQHREVVDVTNEAEFVCSKELACRLMSMFLVEPKADDLIENMLYASCTAFAVHGVS